jgi:hypothetical protein
MKTAIAITVGIVLVVAGAYILVRYNVVPGPGGMVYRMNR